MIYKNKKTGGLYIVLANGIDCTNERDGMEVIIYRTAGDTTKVYIREAEEFYEKFIECNDSTTTNN